MKAIAAYFGVHYSTVSRAVSLAERGRGNGRLLLAGRRLARAAGFHDSIRQSHRRVSLPSVLPLGKRTVGP